MKSGRYTIKELFNEGDIGYFCIPEIQRDYVWGEGQIRPFIEKILKSMERSHSPIPDEIPEAHRRSYAMFLEQSNHYNIGFIYAYFDRAVPERFFLVDGQQRLTSLYLFLAVLASKGHDKLQRIPKQVFPSLCAVRQSEHRIGLQRLSAQGRLQGKGSLAHCSSAFDF